VWYAYGPANFYNNTFHSNGTNSNNNFVFGAFSYTTYGGVLTLRNNALTKSSSNGRAPLWLYDADYYQGDYNNIYKPGGAMVEVTTGYTAYNNVAAWRAASGKDMNSLRYNPGYMNAASGDL